MTIETAIALEFFICAFLALVVYSELATLWDKYKEFTAQKNRAKYRKAAYERIRIEKNREKLWKMLKENEK